MTMAKHLLTLLTLFVVTSVQSAEGTDVSTSAKAYYPKATWQEKSVLTGDFTCQGRQEYAILGTSEELIVIAVFVRGLGEKPEILEYSAKARVAKWAELSKVSLDYDPMEEVGYELEGFARSKTCSGLNLTDNEIDSAHIYWDVKAKVFRDWVR